MTFNHKLVNKLLEAILPLPENFGVIYGDNYEEPINYPSITNAIKKVDPLATIDFGASKMVIMSPMLRDIVIKIPFNGNYSEDEETGELFWNPFNWANGSDGSDYCLTEYEKYGRLKTYGLNCFVAKTYFYKTICGIRIFLQEEIILKNEVTKDSYTPSRRSKNIAYKWYREDKFNIDPDWIANCLDLYGKSKVERFLEYCDNIDQDILEDVHSRNFGYRKNGTPCILDYSSFND